MKRKKSSILVEDVSSPHQNVFGKKHVRTNDRDIVYKKNVFICICIVWNNSYISYFNNRNIQIYNRFIHLPFVLFYDINMNTYALMTSCAITRLDSTSWPVFSFFPDMLNPSLAFISSTDVFKLSTSFFTFSSLCSMLNNGYSFFGFINNYLLCYCHVSILVGISARDDNSTVCIKSVHTV